MEYERLVGEMSRFTPHGGHITLPRTHRERLHTLKRLYRESVHRPPHPISEQNGNGNGGSVRS